MFGTASALHPAPFDLISILVDSSPGPPGFPMDSRNLSELSWRRLISLPCGSLALGLTRVFLELPALRVSSRHHRYLIQDVLVVLV